MIPQNDRMNARESFAPGVGFEAFLFSVLRPQFYPPAHQNDPQNHVKEPEPNMFTSRCIFFFF